MEIQWFPGHMAKTLRQLKDGLKLVEAVVELRDARAPASTANPEVARLARHKERYVVFTKADLADPEVTQGWSEFYQRTKTPFFTVDPRNQASVRDFVAFLTSEGTRTIKRYMVVGVPNVGKSTLINAVGRKGTAKTGDKPGLTRGLQWVKVTERLELLDTPGLLWPKFANQQIALNLALIGSISSQRYDAEEVALHLLDIVEKLKPGALENRYGVPFPGQPVGNALTLYNYLGELAHRRGYLQAGGVGDTATMAVTLLKEFREGKLGRISLERPEGYGTEQES